MDRAAGEPAGPGRQALVLLAGVATGFLVGAAVGAPFDIDVGAGHAIFHLSLAMFVGLAALWLLRRGTSDIPSRFARWSTTALAVAQLAEGVAAIPDGRGNSTAHEVPNVVSLVVLQPLVLLALCALGLVVLKERLSRHG